MVCAATIFTTVTTLLRHLARVLRSEKQTCGHTILKISEKKQVYTKVKVISHV